jgi:hypothetical protein
MEPPFREDLSAKAEKYPLLEAVIRERLMKTQQAGKDLACAMAICRVWRLAMTLSLRVVQSCVYKWSINPISKPKARQESL